MAVGGHRRRRQRRRRLGQAGAAKWRACFPTETGEVLPYLASLLSLPVGEPYAERVKYLDGEAMGQQIFLTSRRFFEPAGPRAAAGAGLRRPALDRPLVGRAAGAPAAAGTSGAAARSAASAGPGPTRRRRACATWRCATMPTATPTSRLAPLSQPTSAQLVHNLLEIDDLPAPRARPDRAQGRGQPVLHRRDHPHPDRRRGGGARRGRRPLAGHRPGRDASPSPTRSRA